MYLYQELKAGKYLEVSKKGFTGKRLYPPGSVKLFEEEFMPSTVEVKLVSEGQRVKPMFDECDEVLQMLAGDCLVDGKIVGDLKGIGCDWKTESQQPDGFGLEVPDKFCYLRAIQVHCRKEVGELLGSDVRMQDVARLPIEKWLPMDELSGLGVSWDRDYLHVAGGKLEGQASFRDLAGSWAYEDSALRDEVVACKGRVGMFPGLDYVEAKVGGLSVREDGRRGLVHQKNGLLARGVATIGVEASLGIESGKVLCDRCHCFVVAEGHEVRCRSIRVYNPRLALVGDAMHQLDVKYVVASLVGDVSRMSVIADHYIRASAQKLYLLQEGFVEVEATANDHTWGTWFEVLYRGKFRERYLRWLVDDVEREIGMGELSSAYVLNHEYSLELPSIVLGRKPGELWDMKLAKVEIGGLGTLTGVWVLVSDEVEAVRLLTERILLQNYTCEQYVKSGILANVVLVGSWDRYDFPEMKRALAKASEVRLLPMPGSVAVDTNYKAVFLGIGIKDGLRFRGKKRRSR